MSEKRLFLLNVHRELSAMVQPLLSRQGFEVERMGATAGALDLIRAVTFHVVVVGLPTVTLPLHDVLRAVRGINSASAKAAVLLAERGEQSSTDAQRALKNGANDVILWPAEPVAILESLARLLHVAPRQQSRVMTRLDVTVSGRSRQLICQSENISASGMLLRMAQPSEIGSQVSLSLQLPGVSGELKFVCEVVRHTDLDKEKLRGVGLRFTDFPLDSKSKLEQFLSQA